MSVPNIPTLSQKSNKKTYRPKKVLRLLRCVQIFIKTSLFYSQQIFLISYLQLKHFDFYIFMISFSVLLPTKTEWKVLSMDTTDLPLKID